MVALTLTNNHHDQYSYSLQEIFDMCQTATGRVVLPP